VFELDGGVLGTVIGSVLGFLASILPEIIALIRARVCGQPYPDASIALSREGVVEGAVRPDFLQGAVAIPNDTPEDKPLNYRILDILRSSVRPVITYAFFTTFVVIEGLVLYHALYTDKTPALDVLPVIWDEGTSALFAAVLAFWFGSRAMIKYTRRG